MRIWLLILVLSCSAPCVRADYLLIKIDFNQFPTFLTPPMQPAGGTTTPDIKDMPASEKRWIYACIEMTTDPKVLKGTTYAEFEHRNGERLACRSFRRRRAS